MDHDSKDQRKGASDEDDYPDDDTSIGNRIDSTDPDRGPQADANDEPPGSLSGSYEETLYYSIGGVDDGSCASHAWEREVEDEASKDSLCSDDRSTQADLAGDEDSDNTSSLNAAYPGQLAEQSYPARQYSDDDDDDDDDDDGDDDDKKHDNISDVKCGHSFLTYEAPPTSFQTSVQGDDIKADEICSRSTEGFTKERVIVTNHGVRVKVSVGDITKARADAVVTSESPYLADKSMVTRALCNTAGGSEFAGKRQRRRQLQLPLKERRVYTIHTQDEAFPFRYVLQAVLTNKGLDKLGPGALTSYLKRLYRNIYKKADEKDLRSVAIPILGTGRSAGDTEESVEAAVGTVCSYRPLSLEEVQFVCLDGDVSDYIAFMCESRVGTSDDVSSEADDETDEEEQDSLNSEQGSREYTSQASAEIKPDDTTEGKEYYSSRGVNLYEETSLFLTRSRRLSNLLTDEDNLEGPGSEEAVNVIPDVDTSQDDLPWLQNSTGDNNKFPHSDGESEGVIQETSNSQGNRIDNTSDRSLVFTNTLYRGAARGGQPRQDIDFNRRSTNWGRDRGFPRIPYNFDFNRSSPNLGFPRVPYMFDFNRQSTNGGLGRGFPRMPYNLSHTVGEYGATDDDSGQSLVDFETVIDSNLTQHGNQPPGDMTVVTVEDSLPGYEENGTIVITYNIPRGLQTSDHPHPGRPYQGTIRRAYLPDNEPGKLVLSMLRIAFDRRLVFTIGRSVSTGTLDVVKWGQISHKSSQTGGPMRYGYPDPNYLNTVMDQLMNLGVMGLTDDMNSLVLEP